MLHISYLYRIHTVTFLPFRAYNTDNQLIINTVTVIAFPHVSNLKSFNVLAKKSLNHYNYIIQAQETLDIAKEIDFRDRYGSLWTNGWMCHSLDCIKFHKRHAYKKLGVANIT